MNPDLQAHHLRRLNAAGERIEEADICGNVEPGLIAELAVRGVHEYGT